MIGWVTNPPTEVRPGQAPCLVSTHRLAPIPTVQTQRTKNQERRTKHPSSSINSRGAIRPIQTSKTEERATRNQEPGTRNAPTSTAAEAVARPNRLGADDPRILPADAGAWRWKWRPIFVVTVESAGADRAVLQLPAARDLAGKAMQAIGGIWAELLQRLHLADLRRNSHQAAAVEDQVPHRLQLRDAPGKFNDLHPLGGSHLAQEGVRPGLRPASHAHQRAV